jgi:hypothetical protein
MTNSSPKHDSTHIAYLHNSTRTLSTGYTISYLYTASNPARPLAAPPHTAPLHAPNCTQPSTRVAHSPVGSKTPEHPWRGWIKEVNGLALTCKFLVWHSWDGPETATGAYGIWCKPAHTVHVVNNFNLRRRGREAVREEGEFFASISPPIFGETKVTRELDYVGPSYCRTQKKYMGNTVGPLRGNTPNLLHHRRTLLGPT